MAQEDTAHYQYNDFIDLSENPNHRYLKISVTASDPAVVEKIASRFPMLDMLRYSGEDLYRFANRDAVKWNAVKAISEYYQISTDEFAAFGDDYIDLEMLQKCGTGVAVNNAVEEVRSAAEYICGSNDNDGAAKWIEEHIL
jgi:hydroxymethylpyrimidine pyrophosphatase-like HAD family hydrolase